MVVVYRIKILFWRWDVADEDDEVKSSIATDPGVSKWGLNELDIFLSSVNSRIFSLLPLYVITSDSPGNWFQFRDSCIYSTPLLKGPQREIFFIRLFWIGAVVYSAYFESALAYVQWRCTGCSADPIFSNLEYLLPMFKGHHLKKHVGHEQLVPKAIESQHYFWNLQILVYPLQRGFEQLC